MQFSDVLNIFIVKRLLNSIFTNLFFFSKNVHSYKPSLFKLSSLRTCSSSVNVKGLHMYVRLEIDYIYW